MNTMTKVLLVEDDKNLSESLSRYLGNEGFQVDLASSLKDARDKIGGNPDVVILDWMLPDGQGIDYLKELHRQGSVVPVILLTSRADLVDKVVGLETGASDYVTKPFEPRELCARIRVQIRKAIQGQQLGGKVETEVADVIEFARVRLSISTREVTFRSQIVDLAKLEFDLLRVLLESPNRVFPREALLNKVWGYENYPTTRTVDNHIVLLRQKLDPNLIETVRGVGYRLRDVKKGAKP